MAICLGLFFGGYRDAAEGHAEPVVMVEPAVAAPDVGTLVVTSAPVGATVTFLSGSHVYRDNMPLETGTYKIRVFKPGYTPNGKQVTVEKGQTTRVFVALKAGVR
ncbi:PEGA domain-containing protein [Desulfoluna spongiiphila]|nr:PEGA domain-containing protein [Desulfoluna spongiiphila]